MTDARPIRIAALYCFSRFDAPGEIRDAMAAVCAETGIRGTLLIAPEGINGTIAGSDDAIGRVLAAVRSLPGCEAAAIKDSWADAMPFHRMKVRLKREIVTMGEPDIDPLAGTGTYVAPADWNALVDDPGTIVIDTRNAYEVKVGSFRGAIDPGTDGFRAFPAWVRANREMLEAAPRIAMFCTGGIRCEKATAFLKAEGIEAVYHLQGGILKYLEDVPAQESRWDGECFVFDERVAVVHGLGEGTHALCRGCRMPISLADRASPLFVEGVACPACHATRDDRQRAGYAERHRQTALAEARGKAHVGATVVRRDDAADRTG